MKIGLQNTKLKCNSWYDNNKETFCYPRRLYLSEKSYFKTLFKMLFLEI